MSSASMHQSIFASSIDRTSTLLKLSKVVADSADSAARLLSQRSPVGFIYTNQTIWGQHIGSNFHPICVSRVPFFWHCGLLVHLAIITAAYCIGLLHRTTSDHCSGPMHRTAASEYDCVHPSQICAFGPLSFCHSRARKSRIRERADRNTTSKCKTKW